MLLTVLLLRTTVGSSVGTYWIKIAIRPEHFVQYSTCSFNCVVYTHTSEFKLLLATKVQVG